MTGRWLVGGGGAAFLFFGLVFLCVPSMAVHVGLTFEAPSGATDVRAIMGGMEVGLGLYLLGCARDGQVRSGAMLMTSTFACMVLGRLIGMVVDGGVVPVTLLLTAAEVGGLVAGAWAWRVARP